MPFVVDASTCLSWCFADEWTPYGQSVLDALDHTHAVVSALWPFEISNVLALAERKRRITPEEVSYFLGRLQRLSIQVDRREAAWVWRSVVPLAREQRLTGYDAAYLDLALREGMPLATLDGDLRKAATRVGVPLMGA